MFTLNVNIIYCKSGFKKKKKKIKHIFRCPFENTNAAFTSCIGFKTFVFV